MGHPMVSWMLSTSFNLLPRGFFKGCLVQRHRHELGRLWKYPQGPSRHPVRLWLWHYNSLPYSRPYSFANQDTIKVRLTVITSNGLDNASCVSDIVAAQKPSNYYSFGKSARYDRPLTTQSTCDNVTKNGEERCWGALLMGGGIKRTLEQQK